MNQEKVEKIKQRFDKIYKRYQKSDKSRYKTYWKLMDALTEEYFKEKFDK